MSIETQVGGDFELVWLVGGDVQRCHKVSLTLLAARLVMGKWSGPSMDVLRQDLGWPLLSIKKVYLKLCLGRRILSGDSLISDSFSISPPTTVSLRSMNTCHLCVPFVGTNYHLIFSSVLLSCRMSSRTALLAPHTPGLSKFSLKTNNYDVVDKKQEQKKLPA